MTYDSLTWPRQCCPRGGDGEPLQVGETVYGEDGHAWLLTAVGPHYVYAHDPEGGRDRRLRPKWLTHEAPDSWGKVERCADMLDGACRTLVRMADLDGCELISAADLVARCKRLAGVE